MAGSPAPMPRPRFVDSDGNPLSGGKVHTYFAGTSSVATTWQDYARQALNPNPVILDVRGEAPIYLDPAINYKFVVRDSADNLIYTQDGIYGPQRSGVSQEQADAAADSATAAAGYAAAAQDAATYLNSYINEVVMNVTFPLDLGLVSDPFIYNTFDLGAI